MRKNAGFNLFNNRENPDAIRLRAGDNGKQRHGKLNNGNSKRIAGKGEER